MMEDYCVVGKCLICGENVICDILPSEAIEADVISACYCGCTVRTVDQKFPKYWAFKEVIER